MKMNKILCLLLVLILVLSLGQSAFASGNATVLIEPVKEVKLLTVKEAADQLKLIASNFKQLKQDDSSFEWKYAVTDLDHDGQLELVAAAMHPEDRSTNFKVVELSEKLDHFVSCNVKLEEGESFPDILSDNADAYYNAEKDTWSYLFFDKVILSEDEVYTSKCAVTLKDEAVSYESFAFEHAERIDGVYHVTYMDPDGLPISPESYNAAGVNAFIDCEKSNVNFDWVDVDKFDQKSASDSYAIFNGEKEPEKILPVIPTPSPAPSPAPSASPKPFVPPAYLLITKNPTNENRKPGSTALFVAGANAINSLTWTFVSPNGGEYSVQSFAWNFPNARVSGQYSTTLSVANVSPDMNRWGVYCTFYYNNQTARTSTAYINMISDPTPSPKPTTPPTPAPTVPPTTAPTVPPTTAPTVPPTAAPTVPPTADPEPTQEPEPEPTGDPEPEPTGEAEPEPTGEPTPEPIDFGLTGTYIADRATMRITGTPEQYYINIKWSNSATETVEWNFHGTFDFYGKLVYSEGIKTTTTYDEEGGATSTSEYCSGTLEYSAAGEYIAWSEAPNRRFNREE